MCEGFKFLDSWNNEKINPDTFRIHAKNVPGKEASRNFVQSVKHACSTSEIKLRKSQDFHTKNGLQKVNQLLLFLIQTQKKKKLCVFSKVQIFNALTTMMVVLVNLNLLYVMIYQKT